MTRAMIEAHRLGQEIEWVHAKDRAALLRQRRGWRATAAQEYDPMTATVLGDLIYSRMERAQQRRKGGGK